MSKITLNELSHSYLQSQSKDEDWAIRNVNIDWEDGGAYALLGPSGCGKTTLLNIISGLIIPTRGKILFNDEDITCLLYTSPSPRDLSTSRMPSSA